MAFCSNCGVKLADGAKFCNECGSPVISATGSEQTERKMVYEGEIHKCPHCGEVLNSFSVNCPVCGYELRGAKNTNAIREFVKKLEEIEASRDEKKTGASLVKILTTDNISKTDEKKVNLIRSFAIPNTKEDVYEFLILAASNIDVKLYGMSYDSSQLQGMIAASQRAVSDAWLAKFEQAYQKAQIMFGDSPEFQNIKNLYEQKMREIGKKKRQLPVLLVSIIGGSILFCVLMVLLISLTGGGQNEDKTGSMETSANHIETSGEGELTQPTSNVNAKEDTTVPTSVSGNVATDTESFNAEEIAKHLKVTEHCRITYGHYFPVLVIENPTDFNLSLSVDMKFYNKDGKLVGAQNDEVYAFEKGTKTIMQFSVDEEFDHMEYEFTAKEEKYYNCVISALNVESVAAKDKEIVSITNTGEYAAQLVECVALFFKDGKLVTDDYTYFTDDDMEIKPGKTITAELNAWGEEYDEVEFYLTGRAEKIETKPAESTTENTTTTATVVSQDVIQQFISGCEKAEFSKFDSSEEGNEFADSRLYFYCTLDETEILEADGTTTILGHVTDDADNKWLIQLHFVPAVSKTSFDGYIGKELILRGVYSGYSGARSIPVVVLDEMIVLETGENILGMQKLLED